LLGGKKQPGTLGVGNSVVIKNETGDKGGRYKGVRVVEKKKGESGRKKNTERNGWRQETHRKKQVPREHGLQPLFKAV